MPHILDFHRLVTLLIYKVLKRVAACAFFTACLVTLLIYKVLKQEHIHSGTYKA